MALLEIKNLVVEFETSSGPFMALKGVDYHVEENEVLAIVGESGSGKSVAMLAIMGLLPHTATVRADKIEFAGQDMRQFSHAQRRKIIGRDISMIFQEPIASLNPCFTVGFQLNEVLKKHTDLGRKERFEKCVSLLESVGMPDPKMALAKFPHQMSGGQCQRVMISIALACNPRVLIADEPTTALDVTIQKQILELLLKIQSETGMAMIMITHDMGVVAETADRVIVQYNGEKMEETDVVGLFEDPQHSYTQALLSALPENATGSRLSSINYQNQ